MNNLPLIALSLTVGAASAATNIRNKRPDAFTPAAAVGTVQVRADSVLTPAELSRAGDVLTIVAFPTDSHVSNNNQDR